MDSTTATEAKKDLYNLILRVNENRAPVTIINSKGKSVVLIGEDERAAIEVTLYLSGVPGMAESILAARAEPYRSVSVKVTWSNRMQTRCEGWLGCGAHQQVLAR